MARAQATVVRRAEPAPDGERRQTLSRENWIEAARGALVRAGIESVKVDRLAGELGVSRGSFYWHFKSRGELLDALVETWIEVNSRPFLRVLEQDQEGPVVQLLRYCEVWLLHDSFDPAYDAAMRDWARSSEPVARAVRHADEERLTVLVRLFRQAGYEEIEALVRARSLYYHQVGYYTLAILQTLEERLELLPTYFRVLTGFPLPPHHLPTPPSPRP